ncbi:MAG: hypothetical protein ABSB35_10745 [Bryobacteraceae bacterium]|jgi:heme/copper-type cytochrome/quinol oxidase subunit 1
MRQHVKILAILHIVLGGLGVLAAIVVMTIFGGLAGLLSLSGRAQDMEIGSVALGVIGAVATIVVLLLSLPGLIAGIGLLSFQPWARILTIVLSALELPGVPLHTALGIYGLWVLLSNEGAALFSHPAPRTA